MSAVRERVGAGRGARLVIGCFVVVLGSILSAAQARAHDTSSTLQASCVITNISGQARMTVSVTNLTSDSLRNLTPSELVASNGGNASIFIQTYPRPLRELLPGKTATLDWKGRPVR